MRFIEDLRNKYKGKEIWILGSGSSLDDYPEDFFDDKISIAMKCCKMIFPNCIHSICTIRTEHIIVKFLKKNPKFLKNHIFPLFRANLDCLGKRVNDPIYMQARKIRARDSGLKAPKQAFFEAIKNIKRRKPCSYPSIDTHLHWTIQVAAILGAKKITLVGCEDKCTRWKGRYAKRLLVYYKNGHMMLKIGPIPEDGYSRESIEKEWNTKIIKLERWGTHCLAQALKRYGIEVSLYHLKDCEQYKAGYLKLA